MNPIPNPDSWMDVLTILAVAGMAAVPSWAALRNHRGIKEMKAESQAIRENVINGHSTPMRGDIDALAEQVARIAENQDRAATHLDGLRDEVRGGFAALRGDMSEERLARRAGDDSIRDEINRNRQ